MFDETYHTPARLKTSSERYHEERMYREPVAAGVSNMPMRKRRP